MALSISLQNLHFPSVYQWASSLTLVNLSFLIFEEVGVSLLSVAQIKGNAATTAFQVSAQ